MEEMEKMEMIKKLAQKAQISEEEAEALLEKNNWDRKTAEVLLEAYDREKSLTEADRRQLYYRFAYPEKFWKIVNFYYNNGKAWIPAKNMEKLTKLLEQEEEREVFLKSLR